MLPAIGVNPAGEQIPASVAFIGNGAAACAGDALGITNLFGTGCVGPCFTSLEAMFIGSDPFRQGHPVLLYIPGQDQAGRCGDASGIEQLTFRGLKHGQCGGIFRAVRFDHSLKGHGNGPPLMVL